MSKDSVEPPQPPSGGRSLRMPAWQVAAIGLMMLLPILAVLGVFGPTEEEAMVTGDTLELTVAYPSRVRYLQPASVEIAVRNLTAQPMPAVRVQIDYEYVNGMGPSLFVPEVPAIVEPHYVFTLQDLAPGTTQHIVINGMPTGSGPHSGTITAEAGGGAAVVQLDTFIFP